MKKKTPLQLTKKLQLDALTVRVLSADEAQQAAGGRQPTSTNPCMYDSTRACP